MSKVTVLGSGAWGTTLAQVLCDSGQDVLIWGRNSDVVNEMNNQNTNGKYLPGITLPKATLELTDFIVSFSLNNDAFTKCSIVFSNDALVNGSKSILDKPCLSIDIISPK